MPKQDKRFLIVLKTLRIDGAEAVSWRIGYHGLALLSFDIYVAASLTELQVETYFCNQRDSFEDR